MSKKCRATITVETERIIGLRRRRGFDATWCAGCGCGFPMIGAEDAVLLTSVTARTICRWIEAERIHFTETPDGLLMVCLKSIYDVMESTNS